MKELVTLTNEEEEIALKKLTKTAKKNCDDVIRRFMDCSMRRTISLFWRCREENAEMNRCLGQFTTEKDRDLLRKELYDAKKARIYGSSGPSTSS